MLLSHKYKQIKWSNIKVPFKYLVPFLIFFYSIFKYENIWKDIFFFYVTLSLFLKVIFYELVYRLPI